MKWPRKKTTMKYNPYFIAGYFITGGMLGSYLLTEYFNGWHTYHLVSDLMAGFIEGALACLVLLIVIYLYRELMADDTQA